MDERAFELVMDSLRLLKESDLTITPIVASPHMLKLGAAAGGIDPATARKVYEAMITVPFETSERLPDLLEAIPPTPVIH